MVSVSPSLDIPRAHRAILVFDAGSSSASRGPRCADADAALTSSATSSRPAWRRHDAKAANDSKSPGRTCRSAAACSGRASGQV